MVGIYPEALAQILGVRLEDHIDQVLPLAAVASPEVVQICEKVFAQDDSQPFARIEAQLALLMRGQRPACATPTIGEWSRLLTTRAVHSTAGRSLRQFQRRVKNWTGQSHRELQLYARVEDAFMRRSENRRGESPDWAALALDAGYSDQSHLVREVRRFTGVSPARLEELMATDEAFWYYRLVDGWNTREK